MQFRLGTYHLLLFFLVWNYSISGQTCNPPIVAGFIDYQTDGVTIRWNDFFNTDPEGWELELGDAGFIRSLEPTSPLILDEIYRVSGLASSTRYEFYIRTVCTNATSDWNGPFFFSTNIQNPSSCGISLPIDDNKCPTNNIFRLDVTENPGLLGQDIILEEVSMIIEHPWPPDLRVALRSPSGRSITLSSHTGIGSINYGVVSPDSCTEPVAFRPDACLSVDGPISEVRATLRPIGDFNDFLDGSPANGTWQLEICDRAQGDIGLLRYVHLSFVPQACPLPFFNIVNDIDSDQATIRWEAPPNCNVIEIEIGPKGFTPGTVSSRQVNCTLEAFTLNGLIPDTEYEIYYRSRCQNLESAYSCPIFFKTSCTKKTISQDFDDLNQCPTSCTTACTLEGFWQNVTNDDTDWIVHSGASPTDFTGPLSDFYNFGKYIYIENNTASCGSNNAAILESDCFLVTSDSTDCQLQFAYHMSGLDINQLTLEISIDDGLHWIELFSKTGTQNEDWLRADINLGEYLGEYCRLRFIGLGADGNFGDIAIDQIDLFVAQSVSGNTLYADTDGDGYGDPDQIITPCNRLIQMGYVTNANDCDDSDASINPLATEIPCNLIDENCNGESDDLSAMNDLDYTINNINNETCNGSQDGFIQLEITGDSGNFSIDWNNGLVGETITGLQEGVYWAEITDASGCKIRTEFIEIDALETITIITNHISAASCPGIADGQIDISHSGAFGPFQYLWSEGSTDQNLSNVTAGNYRVSITDNRGCLAISEPINIPAKANIVAGVQLQQDISCFGEADGYILLGVSQGQAPYQFLWSSGHTHQAIDSLSAGEYAVTITDALGCNTVLSELMIIEPDSLWLRLDSREDISCPDNEDGQILITAIGGQSPITYQWSNGSITDDLFGLKPGNYSVTATDAQSCSTSLQNIEIVPPPEIEISLDSLSQVDCQLSETGHISVNVTGGRGNYFYSWSIDSPSADSLTNLLPGFYNITVIDEFNCKASRNQIEVKAINQPISVSTEILNDNSCYGEEQAILTALAESDRLPIDYNWSAGQQSIIPSNRDTIYDLPSGSYQLTITDNEGCTGVSDILALDSFQMFRVDLVEKLNVACNGDSTGQIDIEIIGGITPFNFSWSDEFIGEDRENLPAGTYQVIVTDDEGCSSVGQDIIILEPDSISVNATITDATAGQNNGQISLDITGGTPPYMVNGQDQTTLTDLASGDYVIEVLDANGCSFIAEYFVDLLSATQDPNNINLKIVPNPASDHCLINLSEKIKVHQSYLMDIVGKRHNINWKQDQSNLLLDLETITTGLYVICIVSNNEQILSTKLIIAK